ncbi:hypothetical protein ACVWU4_000905 [Campylobacter coli]
MYNSFHKVPEISYNNIDEFLNKQRYLDYKNMTGVMNTRCKVYYKEDNTEMYLFGTDAMISYTIGESSTDKETIEMIVKGYVDNIPSKLGINASKLYFKIYTDLSLTNNSKDIEKFDTIFEKRRYEFVLKM